MAQRLIIFLFSTRAHISTCASLSRVVTTEETVKSAGTNKAASLLQMVFWEAYLAVHTHFIFKAMVDLIVECYQVSGKQDCWFQLTKNPNLLQMPLHGSVGVLLALVLQCILTTLHTLPSSSKQPNLHTAAVKTKEKTKQKKKERKSSSSVYIGEKAMMNTLKNSQWSRTFSSSYYNLKWFKLE